MSKHSKSNNTQDLNDLQGNEQAFLADSTDDDIDLEGINVNTQANEDKSGNAKGDQGTKADNTDKTDDTGDTDMKTKEKTKENTQQQPPNQSVPPQPSGINKDHPAAQQNVNEDIIEDELDEDQSIIPDPPTFSFDPAVLFHNKFKSWTVYTNNDFSQSILEPCVNVESFDENNEAHKRILKQCYYFNVIQWFKTEKAVILPPMYIDIRYKDTLQDENALLKALSFDKVQNAYSFYLLLIFIRHFNPALFYSLRQRKDVLKVVQFVFRPKMVFIEDFQSFENSIRGDALAVKYMDHTYEAAFQYCIG